MKRTQVKVPRAAGVVGSQAFGIQQREVSFPSGKEIWEG